MGKKVMIAMSGGVDSSVAAMLLKDKGYNVSGVTMCLGIAAEEDGARCCGATAIDDAKRVCDRLKIPHYVFDYAGELEDKVIAKFISEYKKGRTPNPCVECNRYLKFGSLLEKAKVLGFDFLATGHYAAIERNEDGYFLSRAKDRKKDQTYFLYSMPYAGLENILFPLSALTKDEVRAIAKKASLPVAEKQESQDICFVTQKNYQQFLVERGQEFKPGPIVDMQGKIMGRHRGIIFHTIGQRGGLGISHPTPLYVVSIDPDKNRIVVGEKKDLMAKGLVAGDINMLAKSWPGQVYAKIRYRKKEALCEVEPLRQEPEAPFQNATSRDWQKAFNPQRELGAFCSGVTAENDRLKVIFAEEQEAITPGQSVVFYANDRVLGGGTIEEVLHGK